MSKKKRCWFFAVTFTNIDGFSYFLCTTSQENAKVIGIKIYHHTSVMLLPYRVKVSDTKVTHFTPILALVHVYIDHIYRNQYRWNKQNTAESQRLKICVQNVHHSREHTHSNNYATVQSLMVSVTVSSLGAIYAAALLGTRVKVNGEYYRNTVLLNMLMLDIRSVFWNYYVF